MSSDTSTQSLLTAVKARYDSSNGAAVRSAGATGFYFGRAPQSATFPFIVANIPASLAESTVGQGTSAGGIYDDISLDVSVYDNRRSPDRALSIIGAWHDAFNHVDLALTGGYNQVMGYKTQDALCIEEPSQKGWHIVATYAYNIAE